MFIKKNEFQFPFLQSENVNKIQYLKIDSSKTRDATKLYGGKSLVTHVAVPKIGHFPLLLTNISVMCPSNTQKNGDSDQGPDT